MSILFGVISIGSLATLFLPAALIFIFSEIVGLILVDIKMSSSKYAPPSISNLAHEVGYIKALWRTRKLIINSDPISYNKHLYIRVALIAASFAISGIYLSINSGDYNDFARTGALIALVGLYSTFIGFRHEGAFTKVIEIINDPRLTQEVRGTVYPREPQYLATRAMFLITIVGTIVWGYGDIFLQKILSLTNKTTNQMVYIRVRDELSVFPVREYLSVNVTLPFELIDITIPELPPPVTDFTSHRIIRSRPHSRSRKTNHGVEIRP